MTESKATEAERYHAIFPKDKIKKKPRPGCCHIYGCRNSAPRERQQLCQKHSMRLWRSEKPLAAFFSQIKDRARRKKINFTITFEYFCEQVAETGYAEQRGRSAHNLHLDRKEATLGYIPGNLQILTATANCTKGATTDKARRRAYVEAKIGHPLPAAEEDEHEHYSDHVPTENTPF